MASVSKRPNGRWRARHRDDAGREHAKDFTRKADATRWLREQSAAVVTGQYVDPRNGRVTFMEYAEAWRQVQMHRQSSQAHVETMLRRHAYPTLGDRPLAAILPSEIQAWVKRVSAMLAPSTVGVLHSIVASVFLAAVRDRMIASNPCEGTRLPAVPRKKITPATTEQITALADSMPPELRALVTFCAGTGMRQGEVFGLTMDRVNFLRREVHVDRQLVRVAKGEPQFGPPKTPASVRSIPLPQVVVNTLAAHLAMYPAEHGHGLVFTLNGTPITRQVFGHLWRPVAESVGVPRGTGLHLLRHYYASLLIRHGESVKTVQARLGHASASETLDTYAHLWPDSEDRTREAIDSVLGTTRGVVVADAG